MKKLCLFILIIVSLTLSSCTAQSKMNPRIFISRLNTEITDLMIADNEVFFDGEKYFCFINLNNIQYAMQFYCDGDENIKKICLVSNNAGKTDDMRFVSEAVINIYAPDEDSKKIINSLFNGERNYYNTQWYRYSFISDENIIYFSISNLNFLTNTDAQLTLKSEDIISFP